MRTISKLNPLSDIEKPLLRLEAHFADLDEALSALPRIERGINDGFAKTNELLARVVELLEESNAGAGAVNGNGKARGAIEK